MKIRQAFEVGFAYDVVFTHGVLEPDNNAIASAVADGTKVVFVIDEGLTAARPTLVGDVERWCASQGESIDVPAPPLLVPGGEQCKNSLDILDRFGEIAARTGLDRHSYVVIIGGGAVLDAVGFAASTVHRGIRQVRVPTTTLSQGDSAVGVKNGVNRFGQKNYYGAFMPPRAVLIDTTLLATLPWRAWISGASEAVKVALIKDAAFFKELEAMAARLGVRDEAAMERLVTRSAEIHLDHIRSEGDAFESGSSRPLDFGHWAAHRLEDMTEYDLLHGEAVSIGIALDMCAAASLGLVTVEERDAVIGVLSTCKLPIWHDVLRRRDASGELELVLGLARFREHLGGELTLAMPDGLGRKRDIHDLPQGTIVEAIDCLEGIVNRCAPGTHI
jgi:3-dehydroquinate synthase